MSRRARRSAGAGSSPMRRSFGSPAGASRSSATIGDPWTSSGPRTAGPAKSSWFRPDQRPRKSAGALKTSFLTQEGEVLVTGLAIGEGIAAGAVQVIADVVESCGAHVGFILDAGRVF